MERHAQNCRTCARARQHVRRASDSFAAIRTQPSPQVSWDAVRAGVHWSISSARRAPRRQPRPAYGWLAAAIASGVVVGTVTGPAPAPVPSSQPVARSADHPPPPAAPPAALVGLVSRASGDVLVDGVRPADLFARTLTPGSRIATADGHVDIQFGDGSAFALGPRSTLELRRFDVETVELAIDGTIDVIVAPRAAGQRFLVDAGEQVVEVRGTQFRVIHDGSSTSVACRHGLVVVSDQAGKLELGAAHRLEIANGRPVTSERVVALSREELSALAQATPLALPLWDPTALAHSSAPLEVATSGHRDVRVDGVELGLAPLRVRVMPGRHTIEVADSAGRYRRAGWVDVAAASHGTRLDVPAEPPATGGITERRRQLRARIDHPRLGRCMRSIAKAGLTGTYVQVEISVNAQGAVGFLNVIDTDLPSATASCVREVLADVRFGPGAAATWREHVDL
jgi:hypothetical protein